MQHEQEQQAEQTLKTDVRIQYESRVEQIRTQYGELEEIRKKLNLSARKISQLLMVDASSWTRWTKLGHKAPPHIWQALSWHLELEAQKSADSRIQGMTALKNNEDLDLMKQELGKAVSEIYTAQSKIVDLQGAVKANRAAAILMGVSAVILGGALLVLFSKLSR